MFGNDQPNTDTQNTDTNQDLGISGDAPSLDDSSSSDAAVVTSDTPGAMPGSIGDPTPPTDTTLPDPMSEPSDTTAPEAPTSFGSPADDDAADDELKAPTSDHDDDLLEIKKSALSQLGPLVDHLDQTPEEKFRTMMMMIQATDDQSLVQAAHDAAQAITDDKTRAQALLDVVNEINYFTQPQKS